LVRKTSEPPVIYFESFCHVVFFYYYPETGNSFGRLQILSLLLQALEVGCRI